MRLHALFVAACFVSLSSSASAEPSIYGRRAVSDITDRIKANDCEGAVDHLKLALKKEFPEVALLAGSMYENGMCVKQDWDKAVPFYVQAAQGGMKGGAYRLAAGYAAPEHGPDMAAALWWASREHKPDGTFLGIRGCSVSQAAADDMDRFVAELQTWPQARLQRCNYMAGVMSTISGEVKYPSSAATYKIGGDVRIRFYPGAPRITLQNEGENEVQIQAQGRVVDGAGSQRLDKYDDDFKEAVRGTANRALQRYPHPDGIPANIFVRLDHRFQLHLANK